MIKNAFWTHDYTTGITSLLIFLKASNLENQQFLQLIQQRVGYESKSGLELAKIFQDQEANTFKIQDQTIGKETSLQYSLNKLVSEMSVEAISKRTIAEDLNNK
ncbi:hypothetical protein FF38_10517, partial [Lucilia cuprina]